MKPIEAAKPHNPKLVYLANPDNPMGTWWQAEVVEAMVEKMPSESLLVLDEAYGEFAPEGVMPSIDPFDSRVLRFRTFSKAFGLAYAGRVVEKGTTDEEMLGPRIDNTARLTLLVGAIAIPISLFLGLIAAMHPGTRLDRSITFTTLNLISLPDFLV